MRTLLGTGLVLFTLVTFTDVIADESQVMQQAQAMTEDTAWMHDDFWADPALTDQPILKTSTASVPVVYDENRVIKAQEYLRAVSKEIDANLLWADNADFERNQF